MIDIKAQKSFQSYIGVVASPYTGSENFAYEVNRYLQLPPFNIPNPIGPFGGLKRVSIAINNFHLRLWSNSLVDLYFFPGSSWLIRLQVSSFIKMIFLTIQVPADAAYLYDAVHIYARALNECLIDENNPRDGKLIFEYIKNRPYKSRFPKLGQSKLIPKLSLIYTRRNGLYGFHGPEWRCGRKLHFNWQKISKQ